jgi:hypothetical protein
MQTDVSNPAQERSYLRECNILEGTLPGRVRGFVAEWAELHQQELLTMWESKNFHKIDPLV